MSVSSITRHKRPVPVCTYPYSVTAVSHTVGKESNPGGKLAEEGWEGLSTTKLLSHTWSEGDSHDSPKPLRAKSSAFNAVITDSGINCALLIPVDSESQSSKKLNTHPFPFCFQDNLILWFFYCTISNLHPVLWTWGSVSIRDSSRFTMLSKFD